MAGAVRPANRPPHSRPAWPSAEAGPGSSEGSGSGCRARSLDSFGQGLAGLAHPHQVAGQLLAALGAAGDEQDRVVAGDGAEDRRPADAVDGGAEVLGGAGRGAQDDEVGRGLGRDQRPPGTAGPAGSRTSRTPRPSGVRSPPSPGTAYTRWPDAPRTREAPSSSRSRESVPCVTCRPSAASSSARSAWERTWWLRSRATTRACRAALVGGAAWVTAARHAVAPAAGRSPEGSTRPGPFQQERQDGLLGVATVLGLVPDHRARTLEHRVADLLAAVGGQAVQEQRLGVGVAQQRLVDLERRETCASSPVRACRPPGPSTPRCPSPPRRPRAPPRSASR